MLIDVVVLAFTWIILTRGGPLFKTTVQTTVFKRCISHALASAAKRLRCVLGMLNSLEVKVLSQPDGGKGSKTQGYRCSEVTRLQRGLKEAWSKTCESMDKNRIGGVSVGQAGNVLRSPHPSKMQSVDPAIVHGRR